MRKFPRRNTIYERRLKHLRRCPCSMGEMLYNPDEKQRQGSSFLFCFVFRFYFNVFCPIHLGYTWDIQCSLLFPLHYYYDISHTLPFYIGPTILSSLQVTHYIYIVLFVPSLVSASARHCHKQTIQISFKVAIHKLRHAILADFVTPLSPSSHKTRPHFKFDVTNL